MVCHGSTQPCTARAQGADEELFDAGRCARPGREGQGRRKRTIISMIDSRRCAVAAGVSSERLKIAPKVWRLATLKKHRAEMDMCRSTGSTSGRNTPAATPRWYTSRTAWM